MVYDLMAEMMWHQHPVNVTAWLASYVTRRYFGLSNQSQQVQHAQHSSPSLNAPHAERGSRSSRSFLIDSHAHFGISDLEVLPRVSPGVSPTSADTSTAGAPADVSRTATRIPTFTDTADTAKDTAKDTAGTCAQAALRAHQLLLHSVYSADPQDTKQQGCTGSEIAARPSLYRPSIPDTITAPFYNTSDVSAAWSLLLDPSCVGGARGSGDSDGDSDGGGSSDGSGSVGSLPTVASTPTSFPIASVLGDSVGGFTYDLVAVGRQVLSDRFRKERVGLSAAYTARNLTAAKLSAAALLEIIVDLDTLLQTHSSGGFLLGRYLLRAENASVWSAPTTAGNRDLWSRDARRIITLWGHSGVTSSNGTKGYDSKLSQVSGLV
jgi:hypothetical protein